MHRSTTFAVTVGVYQHGRNLFVEVTNAKKQYLLRQESHR